MPRHDTIRQSCRGRSKIFSCRAGGRHVLQRRHEPHSHTQSEGRYDQPCLRMDAQTPLTIAEDFHVRGKSKIFICRVGDGHMLQRRHEPRSHTQGDGRHDQPCLHMDAKTRLTRAKDVHLRGKSKIFICRVGDRQVLQWRQEPRTHTQGEGRQDKPCLVKDFHLRGKSKIFMCKVDARYTTCK